MIYSYRLYQIKSSSHVLPRASMYEELNIKPQLLLDYNHRTWEADII